MAENEKKVAETAQASVAEADKKSEAPAPKAPKPKKEKVKFTERAKKFWRDYKSEFKKIVWPSKEETTKSTVVVIITIAVFAISIGILDFLFSKGLTLLSHL
ncbi:MAG: preprotein translocase subunit SecE [Clostridia bacterium]|nr:preprotein translocase subunit SecE [Clostridia bacterium]